MKRLPLRVGLTGNIGSGKSTAARLLEGKGAEVIDADALAREATEDPAVLAAIAERLGRELVEGGKLNRAKVAARVFADPEAREVLNGIVHPWVRRRRDELLRELAARAEPPAVVVLDIPLLFEVGLERECDAVIVVTADLPTRVARVQARSSLSADEIRARDAAQLPLERKAERADFVLDNSGSFEDLSRQVDALWPKLLKKSAVSR